MENKDIRWQQRLQNFEKTLHYLEDATKLKNPDIIQKAGMIQFFEMCFELAWNTVKDYLHEQGFTDIKSPRSALKKGFEIGLLKNGHDWMQLLEDRNTTSHAYDEETVTRLEGLITEKYYPLFKELSDELRTK